MVIQTIDVTASLYNVYPLNNCILITGIYFMYVKNMGLNASYGGQIKWTV